MIFAVIMGSLFGSPFLFIRGLPVLARSLLFMMALALFLLVTWLVEQQATMELTQWGGNIF